MLEGTVASLPYVVVDGASREIEPISRYLRDLLLGDVSPLTCRSYGHDLLRWFRLLWAVGVGWEQATEAETATLVGWLRSAPNPQRQCRRMDALATGTVNPKTGKPTLGAGYASRTIAHNLSVVYGFYAFHLHFGRGPVINPVPDSRSRRRALAHVSPIEPARPHRRARLRPKVPARQPRAIPDSQWEELFAAMRCIRDRALLACYVSSGARASELLGVQLGDVEWTKGQLWVISKGTRLRQAVPVSPEALAYLAGYLEEAGLPAGGDPVRRTRRGEPRPLSYWAARRILPRRRAQERDPAPVSGPYRLRDCPGRPHPGRSGALRERPSRMRDRRRLAAAARHGRPAGLGPTDLAGRQGPRPSVRRRPGRRPRPPGT
ncbi:tyrosine-type recombinase/integrase [Streptomyces chartreusis]|uniref:tyrosine-type recombinase/integrase n=1 Tax=Streptomyces chartreusis TaxID=1969 RepID=UPI0036751AE4